MFNKGVSTMLLKGTRKQRKACSASKAEFNHMSDELSAALAKLPRLAGSS
jgi:hypothetical protein